MEERADQSPFHYWLALLHAGASGNDDLSRLLENFGTAQAVVLAVADGLIDRSHLSEKVLGCLQKPDWEEIGFEAEWLEREGHHLITLEDKRYPALLRQIPSPPIGLFVSGDPDILMNPQIAVVGSRRPTFDGKKDAGHFAGELAGKGIAVTSGMANGIDTQAHRSALSQQGKTVAVLGSGLNCIYPKINAGLADKIREEGALVSEFPLSWRPFPGNFPRRNRIISGLSLGVLVVEATEKSGSLITAKHALEQNREVFAVPGSIRNPLKKGCHGLIQNGAKLVGSIDDIFAEITQFKELVKTGPETRLSQPESINGLDEQEKVLLDNIGYEPISLDEIVFMTRISVEEVMGKLLRLELDGLVSAVSPGLYIRK